MILGLCLGSSAFFSITFGEKNIKRLKNGMFISFVMIGIFSLILTFAVILPLRPDYENTQVPYDIQGIMSEYLKWIFVGIFATFLYNYFSNLLRGIGNSVIPLVFLCVSVILNIGLDLYFVFGIKARYTRCGDCNCNIAVYFGYRTYDICVHSLSRNFD